MDSESLERLLEGVQAGKLSVSKALDRLRHLPFENLGFAHVDHHRALRQGYPEVILAQGKTVEEIAAIARAMRRVGSNVLITRLAPEAMPKLRRQLRGMRFYPRARVATWIAREIPLRGKGLILVISAGTSDMAVAEEAALTCEMMGNRVDRLFDVGVAGIHRLLQNRDKLLSASVLVVVAGMEGALPSVVGGLVDKPVIAVPTSVGYGASFGGLAALLGMLNSCAAGVTVVNIDNGFGAGFAASLINRL
ncbi:MAG TPA: nickel pincer cofactor biosynthesis protein LarB [Candidatus Acidoferrales bacterium]|nr:nickel pincer cofactor biosynthesis protein LarB [Candidatus Acidoferrales bacterium]